MQNSPSVALFAPVQACLGESPVWDAQTNTLFYIDITAGAIYALQGSQAPTLIYRSTKRVGALAMTRTGNLIFTEDAQVALLDLSSTKVIARSAAASTVPTYRYNDGACCPQGRFITGLMDEKHGPQSGSLHSYNSALEKREILSQMGLPNGIAWSATGETLYYVDSVAQAIYQAEWCAQSAQLLNRRLFVNTPTDLGRPDGIALDTAGNLWVCQFNGGCLLQYRADGHLLQKIPLPVPRPTSCCFGGEGLATLFITSARFGMNEQELRQYPQSGDIFYLMPETGGIPVAAFQEPLFF